MALVITCFMLASLSTMWLECIMFKSQPSLIRTGCFLVTTLYVTQVGKHYIVDATEEEESQMSSAMSISVNRKGLICGLSKRGGAGVDPSIVLDMISVAKHVTENFINNLDSEIAAAEAREEES